MPTITKVTGSDCLEYINRYLGFATTAYRDYESIQRDYDYRNNFLRIQGGHSVIGDYNSHVRLYKISHNANNRIVGLVTKKYDDGGLRISILGNETLDFGIVPTISHDIIYAGVFEYRQNLIDTKYYRQNDNVFENYFPPYQGIGRPTCSVYDNTTLQTYAKDDIIDLNPIFINDYHTYHSQSFISVTLYDGHTPSNQSRFPITTNKSTTMVFGQGREYGVDGWDIKVPLGIENTVNPLNLVSGAIWDFIGKTGDNFVTVAPSTFDTLEELEQYRSEGNDVEYYNSFNNCTLVFNLLLTENETQALEYLNSGTLPSDAFLYPLDFENLPKYQPQTPGQDDDDDDGGNPDDDAKPSRDVDPTPVVAPSLLPTMFNANNMYWLNIGEFNNFLIWFWYDIQQFSILNPSTWDNLFDNIQGLYADLASAIIGVRYYPIDPDWVGGLGSQEVIKIAQVQKDGLVNTISKLNAPPIRNIGSYTVNKDFDSFLDLPPYSELSLYLPYYGYISLDMDMFNGHSIDVKATYDILSGTITYYIFYDNTFMVNTYTAKLAVDVPITLQTSYDRDRAIQNNIATSLSGFMSAGAGMMSGNPIGMVMGINSLNTSVSPQNTAPIKVEGMTVEQGSLYLPSKCAVILRRPVTTKKGASFAKNNGYLYCKTAKLSDLTGLTIVKNPHIRFNGAEYYNDSGQPTGKMLLPLESEIQEIYRLLEGGVII